MFKKFFFQQHLMTQYKKQSSWFLLIVIFSTPIETICGESILAFSHLSNSENIVGWALAAGANALEIDVIFTKEGKPLKTGHGSPCDCSCFKHSGICQYTAAYICPSSRPISAVLSYLMSHELKDSVAMVYIDSKVDDVSKSQIVQAGQEAVLLLEEQLFSKGYKGSVIIGGNSDNYIKSLVRAANQSHFSSQIYLSYEVESRFDYVLKFMSEVGYPRFVVVPGVGACALGFGDVPRDVVLERINKAKEALSEVVAWTRDNEDVTRDVVLGKINKAKEVINEVIASTLGFGDVPRDLVLGRINKAIKALSEVIASTLDNEDVTRDLALGRVNKAIKALSEVIAWTLDNEDVTRDLVLGRINKAMEALSEVIVWMLDNERDVTQDVVLGRINKTKEVLSEVIVWMLDNEGLFDKYYDVGARGFMSNNVDILVKWAKRRGYDLYKPGDLVGSSFSNMNQAEFNVGSCRCKAAGSGCVISSPAPPSAACRCVLDKGDCVGEVVGCKNTRHPQCTMPDTTYSSCDLGSGDCMGYPGNVPCACEFGKGGCVVSVPVSKAGKACRCSVVRGNSGNSGSEKCEGVEVDCSVSTSQYCTSSTSVQSCLQGGGDCGGYAHCTCRTQGSGCVIETPALSGSACKCMKDGVLCSSTTAPCLDIASQKCESPDTALTSCVQGGGNCDGYQACQCKYTERGCVVTTAAPRNTACRCTTKWIRSQGFQCFGSLVACGESSKCVDPDTSLESCHQGLGNCAGY